MRTKLMYLFDPLICIWEFRFPFSDTGEKTVSDAPDFLTRMNADIMSKALENWVRYRFRHCSSSFRHVVENWISNRFRPIAFRDDSVRTTFGLLLSNVPLVRIQINRGIETYNLIRRIQSAIRASALSMRWFFSDLSWAL
jgi:hypothetical protein